MRAYTPRRLLNISILVIIAFLVLPIYVDLGLRASLDHIEGRGTVGGIDFKAYYLAAHLLQRGENFYDVRAQEEAMISFGLPLNDSLYIYPPLLAILFLPLTALSLGRAAQVWFLFNLALYGLTLAILVKSTGLDTLKEKIAPLILLAFLFAPALFTLYKGQINLVILFLLALTYWFYRRGNLAWVGVSLACATMIKVVPGLLILYFLWKREYKLASATTIAIVLMVVIGLLVAGLPPHLTFLQSVLPTLARPRPNPSNLSLAGFFSLLLVENPFTSSLVDSPSLWRGLALLASSLLLTLTFLVCARHAPRAGLEISLFVATMPLIAQIGWVDFYVLLLLPYAVLVKHLPERGSRVQASLAALSFILLSSPRFLDLWTNFAYGSEALVSNVLVLGTPLCGALTVWGLLAWLLWVGNDET